MLLQELQKDNVNAYNIELKGLIEFGLLTDTTNLQDLGLRYMLWLMVMLALFLVYMLELVHGVSMYYLLLVLILILQ